MGRKPQDRASAIDPALLVKQSHKGDTPAALQLSTKAATTALPKPRRRKFAAVATSISARSDAVAAA
jgi:hypothetical protein